MNMTLKIVGGLLALLILALAIAIMTFDVNAHRGEIEAAINKQTGRSVKLGGPIKIGLSMDGLTLAIRDVGFGNPSWASRPDMAGIGLFSLKVGLFPLLKHEVIVNGLTIENADIMLESASGNRHNWELQVVDPQAAKKPPQATVEKPGGGQAISMQISNLAIKNSQISFRAEDGKVTVFKAETFTLGREGGGTGMHFTGNLNDANVTLTVKTSADALTSSAPRPVDLDLNFSTYHLTAKGSVDVGAEKADLESYEFSSGGTKISGQLLAAWGGERPALQGTLTSNALDPNDLKMAGSTKGSAGKSEAVLAASTPQRVFSAEPLDLAALKSADVNLDVAIAAMKTGSVQVTDLKTKLVINNGHLLLSPLTMMLGKGTINGQINLDASNAPAKLGTTIALKDVDLSDIIKAGGAEAFLSGKVNADINLASNGGSMHEFAGNLNGSISMIGAGGDVVSSASGKLASGIEEILSPGTGNKNEGMNCMVVRFIAHDGDVKSNGILIDTAAATAAGFGDIDLRSETINLDFHAKTKLVNVGGLVPPLHIGGTLSHPNTSLDPRAIIQNVGQMLLGGTLTDAVPDVVTQSNQNACAYALEHPTTVATGTQGGGVVQSLAGKASNQLKNLNGAGGQLLKGLFGQ